jgi:septal ring factor EnvC (AmiA/AmiB activator)
VRLERAVRRLAENRIALSDRVSGLDADIEKRNARIRELEAELRESARLREEVAKRIDDLMARLDQIEADVLAEPVPVAIGRGK